MRDLGSRLHFNRQCDRFLAEGVAAHEAAWAWKAYRRGCSAHSCFSDTKRGFVRGYIDTAMGGDGRSPIVPEERYWSTLYQSRYGQQRINSWYQGYPMGVDAARKKGHGYQLRTPVTEEVSAFYAASSPAGQAMGVTSPNEQYPVQPVHASRPIQPSVDPGYQQYPATSVAPGGQYSEPAMQEYIDLPQGQIPMPNYQPVPGPDGTVEYYEYLDNPSDATSVAPGVGVFAPGPEQQQNPFANPQFSTEQQYDAAQFDNVQQFRDLQQQTVPQPAKQSVAKPQQPQPPRTVSPESVRDYLNVPVDEVSSPEFNAAAIKESTPRPAKMIRQPMDLGQPTVKDAKPVNPFALPAPVHDATPEHTSPFSDIPDALLPDTNR